MNQLYQPMSKSDLLDLSGKAECRDLAQAKPGQLAIEGNVGREYTECIIRISKVYKTGNIVTAYGDRYSSRYGAKEMRRTGGGYTHSLRPFKEGETVESFLATQEAKRQAKEDEAAAAANAKEAEHARRLALLGGDHLWENREEFFYGGAVNEPAEITIVVFTWKDALERIHVTHCHIPAPVDDWKGKPGYYIRIWDVVGGNGQTGASSAQGEDPRDAIERWITQEWA